MKHTDKLTTLFDKIETSINLGKEKAEINYIKYYEEIIKSLVSEGIIKTYTTNKEILTLFFNIKSNFNLKIKRVSKPSKRIYFTSKEVMRLGNSNKLYLFSTSRGIMNNKEASLLEIGGEVLCEITQYVNHN